MKCQKLLRRNISPEVKLQKHWVGLSDSGVLQTSNSSQTDLWELKHSESYWGVWRSDRHKHYTHNSLNDKTLIPFHHQSFDQQTFPVCVSDGGDVETRWRDGDERQASAVSVFGPGGETQTAVSGQRIVWYQRSGQVSSSYVLHLSSFNCEHQQASRSQLDLLETQHGRPHHGDSRWWPCVMNNIDTGGEGPTSHVVYSVFCLFVPVK